MNPKMVILTQLLGELFLLTELVLVQFLERSEISHHPSISTLPLLLAHDEGVLLIGEILKRGAVAHDRLASLLAL